MNFNKYNQLQYSSIVLKMSTQTLTEQVHLVNIITIAEDRLQTNFKNIVAKLKTHDTLLKQQNDLVKKTEQRICSTIAENQHNQAQHMQSLQNQIQKCFTLISQLTSKQNQHAKLIDFCQAEKCRQEKEIADLSNIFDEKIGHNRNQLAEFEEKLNKAQTDIYKVYQEILKKQDSTEVLKIFREVQNSKEKITKNQKQFKILQHKLQKMEIQSQKSERNQSKKQFEFMKEIQDKIKKQLKNLQKNLPSSSRYSSPGVIVNLSGQQNSNQNSVISSPQRQVSPQKTKQSKDTIFQKDRDRLSFQMQDDQASLTSVKNNKNNSYQNFISKMSQKLVVFEAKFKSIEDSVHVLSEGKRKNLKSENDENLKEKINQIKPQLIKLWAKCDTLDDRIIFNERKIQQKAKVLNTLLQTQKQNGVGRLDEKFKVFQTQIYATLKQLKTKVDSKVNCQDYEKQSFALEQKLRQLSEIIFLKSDKLQVKKALLFLQSKIKQIILVISEDQQNEKDALLTKKQLKCMSCDKDIDKMSKFAGTSARGNWDSLPIKDHSPQLLGKFGMTGFGTLSKKLKKLESKDLPVLKSKKSATGILQPIMNTIPDQDTLNESK